MNTITSKLVQFAHHSSRHIISPHNYTRRALPSTNVIQRTISTVNTLIQPQFSSQPRRTITSRINPTIIKNTPVMYTRPPIHQSKRNGALIKPIEMDKDVPVLMKKPGKDDPLVFLPREPHPWWQIWSIPEVVPLTRRSVVAMFWVYFMVGAIVQMYV